MRYDPTRDRDFQLAHILNNGIEFSDNIRGGFVEFTTTGSMDVIQHNLGFVPIGWVVIYLTGPVDLYAEAGEEWNKDQLYLRSSVPNVTVRLFVL